MRLEENPCQGPQSKGFPLAAEFGVRMMFRCNMSSVGEAGWRFNKRKSPRDGFIVGHRSERISQRASVSLMRFGRAWVYPASDCKPQQWA
jgi:hypothetical protein